MRPTQIACGVANIAKSQQHSICFIWSLTCHVIDQTCSFFVCVFFIVLYTSLTFPFLIAGFQCCYSMCISPISPTWARWQLQGFQAERRHSSTAIICGDPCHTLFLTLTHTHTHAWPTCLYSIRIQSLIQHTRLNTHTYTHTHFTTPSCPMLFLTHKWSKQIQRHDRQTDRQTYHYPSLSISLGVWW